MLNPKWLIAAFAIVTFASNSSCASVTKQEEVSLELEEKPKPEEPDTVPSPAPEPSLPPFAPAIVPADSNLSQLLTPPRRVVSYDQRQEGKYNIRADLENFMIVLIPSSPSSGSSLLDLLTRSAQQKSKGSPVKNRKKYHGSSSAKNSDKVHLQPDEAITNKLNNLHQAAAAKSQFLQLQASAALAAEQARRNQPFIEGRTPYHVDISSSELSAAELYKQHQRTQTPLFRMLQPLLQQTAEHVAQRRSADPNHRNSKSLSDANNPRADLLSNSVVLAMGPLKPEYFGNQHRSFGSDYVDPSSAYDFVSINDDDSISGADSIDRLAAGGTSKSGASNDGWDQLTLLGAQEQCGPDRRRDSYGICQFVSLE